MLSGKLFSGFSKSTSRFYKNRFIDSVAINIINLINGLIINECQ